MKSFKNKVAAITGAASGMGRTLALELARRGCHQVVLFTHDRASDATLELLASQVLPQL